MKHYRKKLKESKAHIVNIFSRGKNYLPLYDFFLALRQNNFLVTPKQITDSNSVVAEYAAKVKNENEICNYLSPIFANSPEEQVQFRQLFEEHFTEKIEMPAKELNFWQKIVKHIKKHRWKYVLLTLLILVAMICLMDTPKLDPQPIITVTVAKDSTGKKGSVNVFLNIDNAIPDSVPAIKLKTTYNWGDTTEINEATHHRYTKEGNYLLTAYSDVFYKGHFQYTDTAQTTAAICFSSNKIKIEPSVQKDSFNVGEEIQLHAALQPGSIDSIAWTKFEDDNTIKAVFKNNNKDAVYSFSAEGQQTIYCTAVAASLNSPCSVKDSISFFVYDAKPKPSVAFNISPGAKLMQPKYKVRSKWFYLASALGILSLFFTSFFALRRSRIKKKVTADDKEIKEAYNNLLQSFSGKSGPVHLPFQNKNYLALPEEEINEVARRMRKRIEDDATFLHLPKTIEKAVVNAGFFQPVHANRTQQSEYLVLIDEQYNNNQQVKLFEYLLELLARQNVFIEKYYYRQQPQFCYNTAQPAGITLEKLSEKYPKHILLIMGNAHQLIYQLYPVIDSSYLPVINRWQYKAVLTPVSFLDWGNKEKKVLLEALPVLPVDIPGQLLLFQKLFGEEINILADLKQYSNSFYETEMVDFENVEELSEYCENAAWANIAGKDKYSNILLQWIAALAVYPKIQWELTLAIGKNILDSYGKGNELNFTSLLRIARIRWMLKGQFPDYTRLELLKKLSKENEVVARETILTLLHEIPETELSKEHFAYEEKETQRVINEFNLYAYDPVKYAAYKRSKELVNQLWTNQQITDAPAQAYIDNKELRWDTLINKPCKPGETNAGTESITADDYFGTSSNAEGLLAKLYLWATAISAIIFVASLIGLIALIGLNFSNKSFAAITDPVTGARPIKINYSDSVLAGSTANVMLQVDTAQIVLDPLQPAVLMLPVDDAVKQVTVIADALKLYDSLMPFNYDAYNISLGNNSSIPLSSKTLVTLQLSDACASNIKNYTAIVNDADKGFIVNTNMVNENTVTASKVCLTSIAVGRNVKAQKLNDLVSAFSKAGINLKPGIKSKYFAAENEIVIYNEYDAVPPVVKPVVAIQISDNSLAKTAGAFKNVLTNSGYSTKPVTLQNNKYNSEISYYDNSMQKDANNIMQMYNSYYSNLKVQARLRKAPAAGDYKNIIAVWMKKLEEVPSAVFDISNITFPSAVTINQKFSLSFSVVNTNRGKVTPSKAAGSICILSEQTCSDFTFNTADISSAINQVVDISKKSVGRHEVRVTIPLLKINKSLGYFNITGPATQKCDTIHGYVGNGKGSVSFRGKQYNRVIKAKGNILCTLIEKNNKYAVFEISKDKCGAKKITAYTGKLQNFIFCDGTQINFTLLDWQNNSSGFKDVNIEKNIKQQGITPNAVQMQSIVREAIFDAIICPPENTTNQPVKTY